MAIQFQQSGEPCRGLPIVVCSIVWREIAYELSLFKTKEENFCNLPERTNWYHGKRIEIIRHDEIADSIELKVEQKQFLIWDPKPLKKL